MYFRKLAGKKCYLSPIDAGDCAKYVEWLNDPAVTKDLALYSASVSMDSERAFLASQAGEHTYSIVDLETDSLIGNCGILEIDPLNQTAEVGIFIGPEAFRGKGYGTEALSLLVDFGFRRLNLHNIQLKVYSRNEAAVRCYAKVGFKQVGARREALLRDFERWDIIFMDILADDFYET
ncbi:MAG: GNAT family N-acetyltransferase [Eubacteriaceae bacterium]|jgi:RimJ/RimL family protein N-acetyltransferase|nr:GNAT family N-acetyltransferase [Eubacteriaceae bacterium]